MTEDSYAEYLATEPCQSGIGWGSWWFCCTVTGPHDEHSAYAKVDQSTGADYATITWSGD